MHAMMRVLFLIATIATLVVTAGCGSRSFLDPGKTTIVPYTEEEMVLQAEARSAVYTIQPGDKFGVVFQYEPDMNQRGIIVMPDGFASVVGVDRFQAVGMSLDKLDDTLTEQLGRLYEHPDITIVMEMLSASRVYILGEVVHPGAVEMNPGGMGVLQAIALGGGFSDDAAASESVVIRLTEKGYEYRRVDLDHLEKGGVMGSALMDLRPNDIIYVPRSAIGDIGYFNKTIVAGVLNVSRLYWDFYALANLDKVDRLLR
jgi:polysaccharide biosynthesis/export protein